MVDASFQARGIIPPTAYLGKYEEHDVASVEMHADMLRAETVNEAVQLGRGGQITVEEDVLNVKPGVLQSQPSPNWAIT
jgi:hypothetical protein